MARLLYRDKDVPPTRRHRDKEDPLPVGETSWSRCNYRDRDVPPTRRHRDKEDPLPVGETSWSRCNYRDKDVPPTVSGQGCPSYTRNTVGRAYEAMSIHLEFALPIRIIFCFLDEPAPHRVLVTVADNGVQRFVPANTVVIIVFLPKRTLSA